MNAVRTAVLRNGLTASRQHLLFARGAQGSLSKAQSPRAVNPPVAQIMGTTLRAGAWIGLQQSMFKSPSVMLRASSAAQARPSLSPPHALAHKPAHVQLCIITVWIVHATPPLTAGFFRPEPHDTVQKHPS